MTGEHILAFSSFRTSMMHNMHRRIYIWWIDIHHSEVALDCWKSCDSFVVQELKSFHLHSTPKNACINYVYVIIFFILIHLYHHIVITIAVNWLGCHSSAKFLQANHFPCQSKCQVNHWFPPHTLTFSSHTCHQPGFVCFLESLSLSLYYFTFTFTLNS